MLMTYMTLLCWPRHGADWPCWAPCGSRLRPSTSGSAVDPSPGRPDTREMPGYGQFCPIAQASEVLTERWTPLVIREMALCGAHRFNDIQRGVPLMSSSLLTKRLRQLERAGIIERRPREEGKGS